MPEMGDTFLSQIERNVRGLLEDCSTLTEPPEDRFTLEEGERAGITTFICTHANGDVVHVTIQQTDDTFSL